MFTLRYQFAEHYTNISLIEYIYFSYEASAFIFTWANCRQVRLDFCLSRPTLFELLLYTPHVYMLNMAQSNRGSWRGKKGCEMVGSYIPPVLHSFLQSIKKKKNLISRFKLHRALQFLIWVTRGPSADRWSHVATMSAVITRPLSFPTWILHNYYPNRYSGLSYSLNTGSLKAENSLNWLV